MSDGINAKKVYTDIDISPSDKAEVEVGGLIEVEGKSEAPSNSNISKANSAFQVEGEVDVEVDNSIVDRGSELLSNILLNGRPLGTVEEAWERVILAEKMRFNLNVLYGNNQDGTDNDSSSDNFSVDDKINNHNKNTELGCDSSSGSTSCLSSKYVAYVNQNYNTPKRIAAVLKS